MLMARVYGAKVINARVYWCSILGLGLGLGSLISLLNTKVFGLGLRVRVMVFNSIQRLCLCWLIYILRF